MTIFIVFILGLRIMNMNTEDKIVCLCSVIYLLTINPQLSKDSFIHSSSKRDLFYLSDK